MAKKKVNAAAVAEKKDDPETDVNEAEAFPFTSAACLPKKSKNACRS